MQYTSSGKNCLIAPDKSFEVSKLCKCHTEHADQTILAPWVILKQKSAVVAELVEFENITHRYCCELNGLGLIFFTRAFLARVR